MKGPQLLKVSVEKSHLAEQFKRYTLHHLTLYSNRNSAWRTRGEVEQNSLLLFFGSPVFLKLLTWLSICAMLGWLGGSSTWLDLTLQKYRSVVEKKQ